MSDERLRASSIAIVTVVGLLVIKLTVGLITSSVSVLSQAVDSATDLVSSALAFLAVRKSAAPPDPQHSYGHSKYENLASLVVGLIIIFAAVLVAIEAAERLLDGQQVEMVEYGIAVMAVSVITNLAVSSYLFRAARRERSMALEADATHLRNDVLSNLGVLIGLALIYLTGLVAIDSLIAIVLSAYIVVTGLQLIRRASADLLDEAIDPEEERIVREVLGEHAPAFRSFHALRTRQGGSADYIEVHLGVEPGTSVDEAHELAHHLEEEIQKRLPHVRASIHVEPVDQRRLVPPS